MEGAVVMEIDWRMGRGGGRGTTVGVVGAALLGMLSLGGGLFLCRESV